MADTKISSLPAASALGGSEQIPGVQSGGDVKITPSQIKTYLNIASPTAKGDLIVGATAGAAAILPIGTDTYVLTADSSQADGLKWAAASGGISTLTVNTTPTSGASANDILISDGSKLQKITPGTGVATALAANVNGSGSISLTTSPSFVTPSLGAATATTINKYTLTAPASGATLAIADGKTLTASNTLTFTGTDSSSVAFGAGGTVVYLAGNQTLTGGFTATSYSLGTITSGTVTLSAANGNIQHLTNNVTTSWTLAPQSGASSVVLEVLNNASGSLQVPATSGYTKVFGAFVTTNSAKFQCTSLVTNSVSTLSILQVA